MLGTETKEKLVCDTAKRASWLIQVRQGPDVKDLTGMLCFVTLRCCIKLCQTTDAIQDKGGGLRELQHMILLSFTSWYHTGDKKESSTLWAALHLVVH